MIIDRINAWILNRLPSRKLKSFELSLDDSGLQIKTQKDIECISWLDIDQVVATRSERIVGNKIILIVGLNDGRTITVPEDDSVWQNLTTMLPKYLVGAKNYQEWILQAAFSDMPNVMSHVLIFRRDGIAPLPDPI